MSSSEANDLLSKPCYLDNSATTRPFDEVIAAMSASMENSYYNPSAAYGPGVAVEDAIENVRGGICRSLGGRGTVVFTSGGTESDNLAVFGAAGAKRGRFITSAIEHPAVAMAFNELGAKGNDVVVLPVDSSGAVSAEALAQAVNSETVLVSIMHVNNETGAVQDIAALAAAAKKINPAVLFHSDGVQAYLRTPAEPDRWGVDLYSVSGHKIHGPKGVGALYIKKGVRLTAQALGGGQEGGLRSGTENVPGIIGLGEAVEVFSHTLSTRRAALIKLKLALAGRLLEISGAVVNGPNPADGAPHILNISFEGVQGEVLLRALAEQGVFVSTGSACGARQRKPSPTLLAMGLDSKQVESAVRISLSTMNTPEEIDRAAETIAAQVKRLRLFKRR
jgi:cysteine desulfurase